ncbi:MAG: hypothetical protein AB8H80_05025 [Planctomycetota bacterium]
MDPMPLPFADARTITGAHVALRDGLDPLVFNPGDPWHRPMNYPRVWTQLARWGLREQHTPWLAAAFGLALVLGLWRLRTLLRDRSTAWLLLLGVFAPTTWLALERANCDLLAFAILAAGITVPLPHARAGALLVTVAAMLKVFPGVALAAFVAPSWRLTAHRLLPAALLFAVYLVLTLADLPKMHAGTLSAHWISYGMVSLPTWIAKNTGAPSWLPLFAAALLLALLAARTYRARLVTRLDDQQDPQLLAAFRAGAAVYLASFAIGENFDYRLIFLLPTLPQLLRWSQRAPARLRRGAKIVTAMVLLLLWSQTWRQALAAAIGSPSLGIAIDEWLSWFAWLGLCTFTALSLPEWCVAKRHRGLPPVDCPPALPRAALGHAIAAGKDRSVSA